ncbi:RNA polymerase, partial [Streptomyces tateyamensis]
MDTDRRDADGRGVRHTGQEQLAAHLPLVYNVVGRALNGHPDTDDVVQETMLRAVDGLPALREPAALRSWLVAIAMNQVRHRYRAKQAARPAGSLDEARELADPAADFVGLTITRLGLSGQRREVAEATRWLDQDEREVLTLWWQEAAGQLDRAELAAALELSPQHAAVRVQRVKERLDTARVVVRALAARPGCPELAELTAPWDQVPGALWRKRIARHARDCRACQGQARDLVPAEGLLAGLVLVPVPDGLSAKLTATALAGHPASGTPGLSGTAHSSGKPGSSGTSGSSGARAARRQRPAGQRPLGRRALARARARA